MILTTRFGLFELNNALHIDVYADKSTDRKSYVVYLLLDHKSFPLLSLESLADALFICEKIENSFLDALVNKVSTIDLEKEISKVMNLMTVQDMLADGEGDR